MPVDEDVHKILLQIMRGFQMTSQEIAKLGASLAVLRRAIATQGFPELDAALLLAISGKNPNMTDS
jgi:hypothetical protein